MGIPTRISTISTLVFERDYYEMLIADYEKQVAARPYCTRHISLPPPRNILYTKCI
jgi:hypothetical protein